MKYEDSCANPNLTLRTYQVKYEDSCREMLGSQSYLLCTMDKLAYATVKVMQSLVHDSKFAKLADLYLWEHNAADAKEGVSPER